MPNCLQAAADVYSIRTRGAPVRSEFAVKLSNCKGAAWCLLAVGLLCWPALAAAQEAGLSYPAEAYNYYTALPMPGESPASYFTRQFNRSRGPYGNNPPIDYEMFPEAPRPEGDLADAAADSPETLASLSPDPSELSESYTEDYETLAAAECGPSSRKDGVFQKWTNRATYIHGSGEDDLGILDLESWVVFGFPFPTRDNPLLVTPGFGAHLLDGPVAPDLPGTLYDVYLQFRWLGKLNQFWGYDLVITPGVYSDFEEIDDEAWRISCRAIATFQWSPWAQVLFGVVYLDREDVTALPAAGVIYEPCDGVRWELIAPRPRYARRYYIDCHREDWWYIAGEFGGGSWSIQRPGGNADVVTLSDYRLLLGWEAKLHGGAGRRLEVGYVFGREIEFASATNTVELDSTFLVRGGITF